MGKGQGFRWHPEACVVDAAGQRFGMPPLVSPGAVVLSDRPAVVALQAAMASPAFRIGAEDQPAPALTDVPVFETLTGGTTGAPRRILRAQSSWTASFAVNAGLFGIGPGGRVAVLGRLVHSLALYGAVEGLHLGAEVHLLDGLRPDRQRAQLVTRGVEVLYATPAQLRLLVEAGGAELPALRQIIVGGARLDPALRQALAAFTGARIREFYGAAEASFITLSDADTPEGSVGRPYPGVEMDLRPAEGEGTEIWLRSPYLALGYAGAAGSAVWQEGWLTVGEWGRMVDGNLYLSGRASRRLRVAEQSVFPEQVEAVLLSLPGVRRAAVLGRADSLRGQVPVAVLVGDAAQADAILAACRARLGPVACPRALFWRDDWPELPSGKVDLAALERDLG